MGKPKNGKDLFRISFLFIIIALGIFLVPKDVRINVYSIQEFDIDQIGDIWEIIASRANVEDEDVFIDADTFCFSMRVDKENGFRIIGLDFDLEYDAWNGRVIRDIRYYKGGKYLLIRKPERNSSDLLMKYPVPMDEFVRVIDEVDFRKIISLGTTDADIYTWLFDETVEPGEKIRAYKKEVHARFIVIKNGEMRFLDHQDEFIAETAYLQMVIMPTRRYDPSDEVVTIIDGEKHVAVKGSNYGQNLIVYVALEDYPFFY